MFLKYEIESVIDKFVPLKKQGKRYRKKQLLKETIRKIAYKQIICRVYRLIREDEDCTKEALNAATNESRQPK